MKAYRVIWMPRKAKIKTGKGRYQLQCGTCSQWYGYKLYKNHIKTHADEFETDSDKAEQSNNEI